MERQRRLYWSSLLIIEISFSSWRAEQTGGGCLTRWSVLIPQSFLRFSWTSPRLKWSSTGECSTWAGAYTGDLLRSLPSCGFMIEWSIFHKEWKKIVCIFSPFSPILLQKWFQAPWRQLYPIQLLFVLHIFPPFSSAPVRRYLKTQFSLVTRTRIFWEAVTYLGERKYSQVYFSICSVFQPGL